MPSRSIFGLGRVLLGGGLAGNIHFRRTVFKMADGVAGTVVAKDEMKRFMVDCMTCVGTDRSHASQLADVLIAGDYRGHYSHGLNRLDMYVKDVKKNVCKGSGAPTILSEKAATAWVEGNNLLGPVVGNFCADLAIKKAKDTGIGWVVAKGSNHYGIAGWYSLRIMQEGLLGMSFTNTSPIVYPTRSSKAALGTNPLTLAAPGKDGDSFVLDMATSAVAIGKVELADRKGQKEIPAGWGVAPGGVDCRDPKVVWKQGGLHPLGGTEVNSGYKGYGMGMLVEIFCGILGNGDWGPNVRKWMTTSKDANLGQCFIAIDPTGFAPGFTDRMQSLIETCRNLPPKEGEKEVLVAGDPERRHMTECDRLGGIAYHPNQIEHAEELAKELGVKVLTTKG